MKNGDTAVMEQITPINTRMTSSWFVAGLLSTTVTID